jgi:hypothetical protein
MCASSPRPIAIWRRQMIEAALAATRADRGPQRRSGQARSTPSDPRLEDRCAWDRQASIQESLTSTRSVEMPTVQQILKFQHVAAAKSLHPVDRHPVWPLHTRCTSGSEFTKTTVLGGRLWPVVLSNVTRTGSKWPSTSAYRVPGAWSFASPQDLRWRLLVSSRTPVCRSVRRAFPLNRRSWFPFT